MAEKNAQLPGETPPTQVAPPLKPLPVQRLRQLAGWAMVRRAAGYVWQPRSLDELHVALEVAQASGRTVVPRGAGYSYGDAALNAEDIVLDCSLLRRVLSWDAQTGVAQVEPGVTVRDLMRTVLADGWWPKVVPGTMGPTLGGAVAMNVHGKNAWNAGPLGDHLIALDLLTPDGQLQTLTPAAGPLWHAVVGGLGMLGIITSITLAMRPVVNGCLQVRQYSAHSLAEMFQIFAATNGNADYLVGWIDGFARGKALGRGLVDQANFNSTSDARTMQPDAQDLPARIAGIVPRSELWRALKPTFTDPGMRVLNTAQYQRGSLHGTQPHAVTHAQFHFFHDYVPNWQRSWLPGGLRQLQIFIPADHAEATFHACLEQSQRAGIVPYLCVFKQHRSDEYLLSYQVDGFSLSLDYHVTAANTLRLDTLLHQLRALAIAAGGRFYLAKDDALSAQEYAASLGQDRINAFLAFKRQLDPAGLLQSNLFRRVFDVPR